MIREAQARPSSHGLLGYRCMQYNTLIITAYQRLKALHYESKLADWTGGLSDLIKLMISQTAAMQSNLFFTRYDFASQPRYHDLRVRSLLFENLRIKIIQDRQAPDSRKHQRRQLVSNLLQYKQEERRYKGWEEEWRWQLVPVKLGVWTLGGPVCERGGPQVNTLLGRQRGGRL